VSTIPLLQPRTPQQPKMTRVATTFMVMHGASCSDFASTNKKPLPIGSRSTIRPGAPMSKRSDTPQRRVKAESAAAQQDAEL